MFRRTRAHAFTCTSYGAGRGGVGYIPYPPAELAGPRAQVYLITELLLGGELLDAVLARGSYSEADARSCAVQLLRGIEYLHSRRAPAAARGYVSPARRARQEHACTCSSCSTYTPCAKAAGVLCIAT